MEDDLVPKKENSPKYSKIVLRGHKIGIVETIAELKKASPTKIAEQTSIGISLVAKLLGELEKEGYVEKIQKDQKDDQRTQYYCLTNKGSSRMDYYKMFVGMEADFEPDVFSWLRNVGKRVLEVQESKKVKPEHYRDLGA